MAFALCRAVLVAMLVLMGLLRRRATALGIAGGRGGTVTGIRRCGSALDINVHLHTLAAEERLPTTRRVRSFATPRTASRTTSLRRSPQSRLRLPSARPRVRAPAAACAAAAQIPSSLGGSRRHPAHAPRRLRPPRRPRRCISRERHAARYRQTKSRSRNGSIPRAARCCRDEQRKVGIPQGSL